ncbi:hypothetical protein ACQPYE_17335 [Actinosynnema sp. CA-299493]
MPVEFGTDLPTRIITVLLAGSLPQEISVSRIRAAAETWADAAALLRTLGENAAGMVVGTIPAGEAAAFAAARGALAKLALVADDVEGLLLAVGLDVDSAERSMVLAIVLFCSAILQAMSSPFTAPFVPVLVHQGRYAIALVLQRLHWSARLLAEAVHGGVQGLLEEAVVQVSQFADGTRKKADGTSFLLSGIAEGAAGGLHSAFRGVADRYLDRELVDTALFDGLNEGAVEGLVGTGMALALGQGLGGVWTGVVNGAATGTLESGADRHFGDLGGDLDGLTTTWGEVDVPEPEDGVPTGSGGIGAARTPPDEVAPSTRERPASHASEAVEERAGDRGAVDHDLPGPDGTVTTPTADARPRGGGPAATGPQPPNAPTAAPAPAPGRSATTREPGHADGSPVTRSHDNAPRTRDHPVVLDTPRDTAPTPTGSAMTDPGHGTPDTPTTAEPDRRPDASPPAAATDLVRAPVPGGDSGSSDRIPTTATTPEASGQQSAEPAGPPSNAHRDTAPPSSGSAMTDPGHGTPDTPDTATTAEPDRRPVASPPAAATDLVREPAPGGDSGSPDRPAAVDADPTAHPAAGSGVEGRSADEPASETPLHRGSGDSSFENDTGGRPAEHRGIDDPAAGRPAEIDTPVTTADHAGRRGDLPMPSPLLDGTGNVLGAVFLAGRDERIVRDAFLNGAAAAFEPSPDNARRVFVVAHHDRRTFTVGGGTTGAHQVDGRRFVELMASVGALGQGVRPTLLSCRITPGHRELLHGWARGAGFHGVIDTFPGDIGLVATGELRAAPPGAVLARSDEIAVLGGPVPPLMFAYTDTRSELTRWSALADLVPAEGDPELVVFVEQRDGLYHVDGNRVDGPGLARAVAGSPALRTGEAARVVLLTESGVTGEADLAAAEDFAAALRDGDGVHLPVLVNTGRVGVDPESGYLSRVGFREVSSSRADDVATARSGRAAGRVVGPTPAGEVPSLVHTLVDEHGPAIISFPGDDRGSAGVDVGALLASASASASTIDRDDVAVTASVRAGRVFAGGQEIPLETFAAIVDSRAGGKRVVLAMPGGDTIVRPLRRLLGDTAVVASRDHLVRPTPEVTVHGAPDAPVTDPVTDIDPAIASVGVPRAGLPQVPELITALRGLTPGEPLDSTWHALHQYLLGNYRYLVQPKGSEVVAGVPLGLGSHEVLIALEVEPVGRVARPAGAYRGAETAPGSGPDNFKAVGTINSVFRLGAHQDRHTGQTGATRLNASLSFGVGVDVGPLQVLAVGGGLSVALNQNIRSTNRVLDAEGGHVEDNRSEHDLVHYRTRWVVRSRDDLTTPWSQAKTTQVPALRPGHEERGTLLLWVADHYLRSPPGRPVVADVTGNERHRLPSHYFASGMTGIPALYDAVLTQLGANGVAVTADRLLRGELVQKLWNLDANLDHAINNPRGYRFDLHDDEGRAVATVAVHTVRDRGARPVGSPSDKSHIEDVRTAVHGTGGGHALTQSTTLSLPTATAGLRELDGSDGGLNVSFSLSYSRSRTDGLTTAQNGLWVVVPRFAGRTTGVLMEFTHFARITIRGGDYRITPVTPLVPGRALVRMPENDAVTHGLPVHGPEPRTPGLPAETGAGNVPVIVVDPPPTSTAPGAPDTGGAAFVPPLVRAGRGIGTGFAVIDQGTVDSLLSMVTSELRRHGFLPGSTDHMRGQRWWHHGDGLDSRLANDALLHKVISRHGIEANWDQIHQDGLVFTLRHRRGGMGVTTDVDSAKITLTATPTPDREIGHRGTSGDYHAVNLAMGMGVFGTFTAADRKVALSVRLGAIQRALKSISGGVGYARGHSVGNSVTFLTNRPELLEYSGGLDEFSTSSDFTVTIEYQHSGVRGTLLEGRRDPAPLRLAGQPAVVRTVPLEGENGYESRPSIVPPQSVLTHAVVHYLDGTGVRTALRDMLDVLVGPAGHADQEIDTFAGTTVLRAFLKEIVNGEFTTDQFFEPGWFVDTHGAAAVGASIGATRYVGSTADRFVLGVIKLFLSIAGDTSTRRSEWAWDQVDAAFGEADPSGPTGAAGAGAGRGWGFGDFAGLSRTAGEELIQLDFDRAYVFESQIDFTLSTREEHRAKLLSRDTAGNRRTLSRTMRFVLAEPEALDRHARGDLIVAPERLEDALTRWAAGELDLSGNVVAGVLARWAADVRFGGTTPQPRLREWAETLARRHAEGGLSTVSNSDRRDAFTTHFGHTVGDLGPRLGVTVPEYLAKPGTQDNLLGHSGVRDVEFLDPLTGHRTSLFKQVKALVEAAAPGLLSSDAEVWGSKGRHIGRLQGGVTGMQALLAQGRDHAMWGDLLSRNGVVLYLVNPANWVLGDVVEIRLVATLTSLPEVVDQKPGSGLEKYGHAYSGHSTGKARHGGQHFAVAKSSVNVDAKGGLSGGLRVGEGHHRATSRNESLVAEQTAYDWGGHYQFRFDQQVRISVRRLGMNGRTLNNFLIRFGADRLPADADPRAVHRTTVTGTLDLQVPRSIAEGRSVADRRPRTFQPVGALPGDAVVVGTLLDDLLPVGEALLRTALGPHAHDPDTHASLNPTVLLSRNHLNNHLHEAIGGRRYRIADNLMIPGRPGDRATVWLSGELHDVEVLLEFTGAGTGRYSKTQQDTGIALDTDHWRPTVDLAGRGTTALDDVQPHSFTAGPAQHRTSPAGQGGTDNVNSRREQHVKQIAGRTTPDPSAPPGQPSPDTAGEIPERTALPEETVVLARLRGRFRLSAETHRHAVLTSEPTVTGRYSSQSVTGDVYVQVFRSELTSFLAHPPTVIGARPDAPEPVVRVVEHPTRGAVATAADDLTATAARWHAAGHRPALVVIGHGSREAADEVGRRLAAHLRDSRTSSGHGLTPAHVDIRVLGPHTGTGGERVTVVLSTLDDGDRVAEPADLGELFGPVDLAAALADVAADGTTARRAPEAVAARLRAAGVGDLPVTLDLDRDDLARRLLPPVLGWAATRVRSSPAASDVDRVIADDYDVIATEPHAVREPVGLVDDVLRHVALLAAVDTSPPDDVPGHAGFIALSSDVLARGIAFELGASVRIVETSSTGRTRESRATPDGRLTGHPVTAVHVAPPHPSATPVDCPPEVDFVLDFDESVVLEPKARLRRTPTTAEVLTGLGAGGAARTP